MKYRRFGRTIHGLVYTAPWRTRINRRARGARCGAELAERRITATKGNALGTLGYGANGVK